MIFGLTLPGWEWEWSSDRPWIEDDSGNSVVEQNILTFFVKGQFDRRCEMKKNILILACLGILVVLPNLVLADCGDVGGFSSFSVSGGNTVTLYSGGTPYVKFDVQCSIQPTSKIQLIKGYVCDGDEILVDGSRCTILNVNTSLN